MKKKGRRGRVREEKDSKDSKVFNKKPIIMHSTEPGINNDIHSITMELGESLKDDRNK